MVKVIDIGIFLIYHYIENAKKRRVIEKNVQRESVFW